MKDERLLRTTRTYYKSGYEIPHVNELMLMEGKDMEVPNGANFTVMSRTPFAIVEEFVPYSANVPIATNLPIFQLLCLSRIEYVLVSKETGKQYPARLFDPLEFAILHNDGAIRNKSWIANGLSESYMCELVVTQKSSP